ncbi:Copper efflux oxidase [Pantoea agglomerans]|uniref:Copper efflux oxidase n=1 Tax=Enterobacter agglomerans TaxID=549 RepID=A0A379AKE7_ENTAG|nr:Copper efflux oxidase [Pantoea agglomerans]
MQRRHFLKLTAALSAAGALPLWSRFADGSHPSAGCRFRLCWNPMPGAATASPRCRVPPSGTAKRWPTWGYNGSLLGPVLKMQSGKPVTVNIHNRLSEATTTALARAGNPRRSGMAARRQ